MCYQNLIPSGPSVIISSSSLPANIRSLRLYLGITPNITSILASPKSASSIITFFMSYTVDVTDFSTVFLFDDRQANRFGILEETNFAMTDKEIDAMQVRNRPSSDKYIIDKIIGQREKIRVKEYFFPNNTNRR